MRSSALALLFGGLVIYYLINASGYSPTSPQLKMQEMVETTLAQGQALMQQRVAASLKNLFDDLDKNKDGVIQREEFKGASLAMSAAWHEAEETIELPELPELSPYSLANILRIIITYHLMFLAALFVAEHLRCIIFPTNLKKRFDLENYDKKEAEKVGKDVALFYDTPLTLYERCKMAFFIGTGLVVTRFIIAFASFTIGILCMNIAVYGGRNRVNSPKWFNFWTYLTNIFCNLIVIACGVYKIECYGKCASSKEAKILVGNHICMVELLILFMSSRMPSFVSRVENLSIPLFRGACDATDAILVDRDAATSRQKTLDTLRQRAKDPNAAQLMVFPEGTCSSQQALFLFKRGAFEAGCPIQMCVFRFPHRHFNVAWTGRDVGGNDITDLILRLFSQFTNRVEMAFLPVYTPTEAEKADSIAYANHVQNMMANALKIPKSDATFADYSEAHQRTKGRRKLERERGVK